MAMIGTILLVEEVNGFAAIFDVLILGVALAVAAVPEGLPAVVTAVLSLGVQRMAKRYAVVRHLAAVETLGSASVIASDKTGTLTKNEMTVRVLITASGRVSFTGTGYAPQGEIRRDGGPIEGPLRSELVRALTAADRANNAVLQEDGGRWTVQGDPTEGALIVAARKAGLESEALDARFARVAEVPFSSERKLMTTVHTDTERQERLLALTKGAPDVLLGHCSHELVGKQARALTGKRRAEILEQNDRLAGEALRTLAVAFRSLPRGYGGADEIDGTIEKDLVLLGLIGMIDPPRDEAKDAVGRARSAGIRPLMITGDHPTTAAVIAAELGIASEGKAITGAELEKVSDDALDRMIGTISVYARVNPEHKLRIVRAFQRQGAVIAMTGDGVNDAPALKTADIGIAMGITGTDVSKEAADMVLADDNFATIIAAVEEGRAIFSNIRKFLRYLLSSNVGEVMTMFFGVLLADAIGLTSAAGGAVVLPLLATQNSLDQSCYRRCACACPRHRPCHTGAHEQAAAPAWRKGHYPRHVVWHPLGRRGDGGGNPADRRCLASRRRHRRNRHNPLCPDNGFHYADALPAFQRHQCPLRRAQRLRGVVSKQLALVGNRTVVAPAYGRTVRSFPADGFFYRKTLLQRLAPLRGSGELGPVAARVE